MALKIFCSVGEANLSKRYTNHCVRTTALQQFTDLRKNYEILENPRPESVSAADSILENGHENVATGLIQPIEAPIIDQNNFREMTEGMTSSLGVNLSNQVNGESSSSASYMVPYSHLTYSFQPRQTRPSSPAGTFVPLMENSTDGGLAKRGYFSEFPLNPPPPYSESSLQRLHSVPTKRTRTEDGFYQLRPQSAPIAPLEPVINPSPLFDIGDSQQSHSYVAHAFGPHSLSNGESFKELTHPVLSPIQISAPHNKKRPRKVSLKKNNKLSETIVSGFPFEFVEPTMDFEKSCVGPQAQA